MAGNSKVFSWRDQCAGLRQEVEVPGLDLASGTPGLVSSQSSLAGWGISLHPGVKARRLQTSSQITGWCDALGGDAWGSMGFNRTWGKIRVLWKGDLRHNTATWWIKWQFHLSHGELFHRVDCQEDDTGGNPGLRVAEAIHLAGWGQEKDSPRAWWEAFVSSSGEVAEADG